MTCSVSHDDMQKRFINRKIRCCLDHFTLLHEVQNKTFSVHCCHLTEQLCPLMSPKNAFESRNVTSLH